LPPPLFLTERGVQLRAFAAWQSDLYISSLCGSWFIVPSVMSFFFSPLVMVDYVPSEVLEKEGHLTRRTSWTKLFHRRRSYILQKLLMELRVPFFPLGCFYQCLQKIRSFCIQLGLNGFESEMFLKVETVVFCPQAAKSVTTTFDVYLYACEFRRV